VWPAPPDFVPPPNDSGHLSGDTLRSFAGSCSACRLYREEYYRLTLNAALTVVCIKRIQGQRIRDERRKVTATRLHPTT
jgi:hypothetical protein